MDLKKMVTEQPNPDSVGIDQLGTVDILKVINKNDQTVAHAVERVLPAVADAVDRIVGAIQKGGRLFYIGAGTSGRLGGVDASEGPPTFGTEPELVQGIIAGGPDAVFRAKEGKEDETHQAAIDLAARDFSAKDVLVGLSTSGRTPYVVGALQHAKSIGATTVAMMCNPQGAVADHADVVIAVIVGPEVITGSTRMKAGTAQKMILNMLTTATMVRLGRVTGNRMTDMRVSCSKLQHRARGIVMSETGCDAESADAALAATNANVREAIERIQQGGKI